MSGTFPSTPGPSSVEISSVYPTFASTTHSLKRITQAQDVQRWAFKLRWDWLTQDEFWPIWAFCMAQRGRAESFSWVPPSPHNAGRGTFGGTPLVNGASQTGRQVVIDGASNSITNWVQSGSFVQFGSATKVYMVVNDENSDGSGNVTLDIEPPLLASPGDGDAVTFATTFNVALASDLVKIPTRRNLHYSFELELVEDA